MNVLRMNVLKLKFRFRPRQWRDRIFVGVLGLGAVVIFVTTIFVVLQIIRVQVRRMGDAVQPEAAPAHTGPITLTQVAPFAKPYELQGMTISLGNRNQTLAAYAEFTLVLDCPNEDAYKWMEMNRAAIRDGVYETTIGFTVEDFNAPEGFVRFKKAIVEGLKSRFGLFAPREIVVRDWVIR